jgi:hypothetical protein
MRGPFDTLFGRLFGVLLVAIVLAHGWHFLVSPLRPTAPAAATAP